MVKRFIFIAVLVSGAAFWWFDLVPHWETRVALATPLADIDQSPKHFKGKRIIVDGRVIGRLSLLGLSAYVLQDEAGYTIDVLGFGATPQPGQRMQVTGELKLVPVPNVGDLPMLLAERPEQTSCALN